MRIPQKPPVFETLVKKVKNSKKILAISLKINQPTDFKNRYLHWDKLKFLKAPFGLSPQEWWLGLKLVRKKTAKVLPFLDKEQKPFYFCTPDSMIQSLYHFDRFIFHDVQTSPQFLSSKNRTKLKTFSLLEEAICSSQLEGAATTHLVAIKMLKEGRKPHNIDEQMIYNNFQAMSYIRAMKEEPLTLDIIFELHRILTKNTLEKPDQVGRFRTSKENVQVITPYNEVVHIPPTAQELPERLQSLCVFANEKNSETFIHPIVRAIILHFMLAYDHPFVEGNGRTARALFYWSMAHQGYWFTELLSISEMIKKAPVQYGQAFLHTETDDNDMTYFIIHQLDIFQKAARKLFDYIGKKQGEEAEFLQNTQTLLPLRKICNSRQASLLQHALANPKAIYVVKEHQMTHGITYETARQDLLQLAKLQLLELQKVGKKFMFTIPKNLMEKIRRF